MDSLKKKNTFVYHPFELAFSGYSGCGKTTLISKIIHSLKDDYEVAYVKHDAHHFEMDKPGKDTFVNRQAGANYVSIHDPSQVAFLSKRNPDKKYPDLERKLWLAKADFVFLEGFKHEQVAKICVLGNEETKSKIVEDWNCGKLSNILAIVGNEEVNPTAIDKPYFQRDNISAISHFVLSYLKEKSLKVKLNGLVLVGGKSSRMGQDKGAMVYNGKEQARFAYELLEEFCDDVFVSCRAEQAELSHLQGLAQIHDQFLGLGPLGGIMSAMKLNPNSSWLIVACDLPGLKKDDIKHLVNERNPFKMSTCYLSEDNLPEPLCAIYESRIYPQLFTYAGFDYNCPRKILLSSSVKGIKSINHFSLYNANTPNERESFLNQVNIERSL